MAQAEWTSIETPQNIKLIVADMDGTLLDADSQIPAGFWPMLDKLDQRGITFVPASGRQYQTLRTMFARSLQPMSFIAENGNIVALDGQVIETHTVGRDLIEHVIGIIDTAAASGNYDLGLVICGLSAAYVQRTDEPFIAECSKYYAKIEQVNDLHDVLNYADEKFLKLAILDFGDAEAMAKKLLPSIVAPYEYVPSGKHWVDIMNASVNKGDGVATLQRALGVSASETAVFGDYLNDAPMFAHAKFSFAMANAHPQVREAAAYIAPANTDEGVLRVIDRLIG
ncbi:Cof-type HAD-IIB family hydrolase [Bifidobacterium canis]|uniref:Haloacid dehalogenase n=1 Tax=Bifidobacterium canis TaxID=2610880 RepID=A0A7K1J6Z4_9BIFI|nr:Cof-type HAD-IIB family hydrolase [Bifidobacterium canis]MUH60434.1 haloacid dehalogenase [Bifidobacterium canis]